MSAEVLAAPLAKTARIADMAEHRARMDQPLVGYRLVAAAGRSPAPVPAFLFGPSDAELARQMHGQVETPEIGVSSIADAAVAPTGIGLCRDLAFSAASLNHPGEHVGNVIARLNATTLPCRAVPGPLVPLFGPAEEDDGILLLDYLPRLWLLERAGYALGELWFLVPDPLGPLLEEVVRLLGIGEDRLVRYAHWREAIRTDLLLLPSILRRCDRLSPLFGEATRFWVERLGLAEPEPADTIYVAGSGGGPVLRNRDRIAAIAVERGYRVVSVAGLGFAERASVFGRARCIVGEYSSALLYSLFSAPGAAVCALRSTERVPGTVQTGVCQAMGQSVGYVLGSPDSAGFVVDESDFRRALDWLELPG